MVLCAAFFIAAIWLVTRPSFEKCSALDNTAERAACFDTLRRDLLKPPAKGAKLITQGLITKSTARQAVLLGFGED